MFTGLVEAVGVVRSVTGGATYRRIAIESQTVTEGLTLGDSVAVDGACQTVVTRRGATFEVESLAETLRKTTLGSLKPGCRVNLERALRVGDRLGGHIVQGHVDGTGRVASVREEQTNVYFAVDLPPALHRYCLSEGSIALDGVSLTIARLTDHGVEINVIPETWRRTALRDRSVGASVNVEADVIARYVERLLGGGRGASPGVGQTSEARLSAEALGAWGYGSTTPASSATGGTQ